MFIQSGLKAIWDWGYQRPLTLTLLGSFCLHFRDYFSLPAVINLSSRVGYFCLFVCSLYHLRKCKKACKLITTDSFLEKRTKQKPKSTGTMDIPKEKRCPSAWSSHYPRAAFPSYFYFLTKVNFGSIPRNHGCFLLRASLPCLNPTTVCSSQDVWSCTTTHIQNNKWLPSHPIRALDIYSFHGCQA